MKLNVIIATKDNDIQEVARVYGVSRNTVSRWIRHVKNMEIDKLRAPKTRRLQAR